MSYRGHLLCAIPYQEPKQVINNIRRCHPNLKVTFIQTKLPGPGTKTEQVPTGNILHMIILKPLTDLIRCLEGRDCAVHALRLSSRSRIGSTAR